MFVFFIKKKTVDSNRSDNLIYPVVQYYVLHPYVRDERGFPSNHYFVSFISVSAGGFQKGWKMWHVHTCSSYLVSVCMNDVAMGGVEMVPGSLTRVIRRVMPPIHCRDVPLYNS